MSGAVRALLGAALGSIIALLLHPVSRPYMDAVFSAPFQPASISHDLTAAAIPSELGRPQNLHDAGLWMQAAAARSFGQKPLTDEEINSLLRISQAASLEEPENAFWKQMT